MARCYSDCVPRRYPLRLPRSGTADKAAPLPAGSWLVSDARIDDRIEGALHALPRGSGLIFRHYHLSPRERRARFAQLARVARKHGHKAVFSASAREARRVGADGAYGSARRLASGPALLRLVTAHSLREIGEANRMRADAIILSPVFPTGTHPGAPALGALRFRLLAVRARAPVIALGGMTAQRATAIDAPRWAAIESLAQLARPVFPRRS